MSRAREMFGSENGVPQYGYQRNRRVKGSVNDLILQTELGKRVLSWESHVSVWKTSFDLSESFLCTIMTYYDFYCLQIDHWDLGVIVIIVSILFVSIKLYSLTSIWKPLLIVLVSTLCLINISR